MAKPTGKAGKAQSRAGAGTHAKQPAPPKTAPTIPAWAPPVVYAVLTIILFRDFFLSGTSMLGLDSLALSYFARNFYTEFVQAFHRMPYWNPLLFGGLPFVEGMHGDIFYPPSLAMFFLDARVMWGWKMALHIFMAGSFTYLWLRRGLGLDRLPAFFGGLVYMMGAELVSLTLPGGDGKLFVSALAPLVFWLAERAAAKQRLADFALFSLGIALILFTSHMQAAFYCVWGVSLYYLFRVWQIWRTERSTGKAATLVGMYALAGVLAVASAAVQFLPPLQYLREYSHRVDRAEAGERGMAWSASYSLNAEEIVSLVIPEFVGELAQTSPTRQQGGYWGRNPLKLNHEYAGLVPLLLIPILLWRRRTPQVWFFGGLAVLTLLYGLADTPLFRLFYLIPGVNLFRSWSIIIFLYGLSVATLGAIAVQHMQEWLTRDRAESDIAAAQRTLWIVAGVFGVLALLESGGAITGLWQSMFGGVINAQALQANLEYIKLGFWIAFALALAVAGTWQLAARRVFSATVFVLLLSFWAVVDSYRVSRPFVRNTALINEQIDQTPLFRGDEVIAQLQRVQQAGGVFRMIDLGVYSFTGGQNLPAIHGLEQVAGHHGNEIGRYRNLIGGEGLENLNLDTWRLLDVTNTAYVVVPPAVLSDARFAPVFNGPLFEQVYAGQTGLVYRKRSALPRAYLVGSTEVIADDGVAISRLLSPEFDARNTAILSGPLPSDVEVQAGATGAVEWLNRQVDEYTLRVAPDRPALLVVLDNYYPAWRATVDDREVPIWRANETFRAIAVPAGEHSITFKYGTDQLRRGAYISLIVLVLLGAVVIVSAVRERTRTKAA